MPEINQEERNIQRRLNQLDRKLASTKPRYTVELTTEGWQIKDNERGFILADVYKSKGNAETYVRIWNDHVELMDRSDALGTWRPASNGGGTRHWFLFRALKSPDSVEDRYHWSAAGQLVRYGSYASAQAAAEKLNGDS
jgi:hypothetical protein